MSVFTKKQTQLVYVNLLTRTMAARVYQRWLTREWNARADAISADAGFDGGEWSTPWHEQRHERKCEAMWRWLEAHIVAAPAKPGLCPHEYVDQFGCPTCGTPLEAL